MERKSFDENPIRTFTAYTYEQAKAFQRYHARRYRKASILLFAVCALALFSAVYAWFRLPVRDLMQLLVFLPGVAALILFAVIFYLFTQAGFYTRRQHERSMAGVDSGQTMLFREKDFLVAFTPEELAQGSFIPYDRFEMIRETDDAFYFYVNRQQALIVVKDGFVSGTAIDMRGVLERAVPDKFQRDLSVRITRR